MEYHLVTGILFIKKCKQLSSFSFYSKTGQPTKTSPKMPTHTLILNYCWCLDSMTA